MTSKDSGTLTPLSGVWIDVKYEMVNGEMGLQKTLLPKIGRLLMLVPIFFRSITGNLGVIDRQPLTWVSEQQMESLKKDRLVQHR